MRLPMDFPGHFKNIFQHLNHQRINGQLCDCVVSVGGQRFHAHRSILAACSSHFRALLSATDGDEVGGTKMEHGDGPCVMELDQEVVTPEAFSTLLEMIYTSTLTPGTSNVMDVLLAASHLHLNTVVKACKLHLSKRDFPTSPPKGWRSVQQQREAPLSPPPGDLSEATSMQLGSVSPQRVQLSIGNYFTDALLGNGEAGTEVSQSGGNRDARGPMNGGVSRRRNTAPPAGHKRTSPGKEDRLSGRKRRLLREEEEEEDGGRSPTVTRSTGASAGRLEEELPAADRPPPGSRGEEEEEAQEEKYEAAKWESEEMELPSQSDGVEGGRGSSEAVVKVQAGEEKQEQREEEEEEEEEEENAVLVEVKRENLSASSPEPLAPGADRSPSPACSADPPEAAAASGEADADPGADPQADTQRRAEAGAVEACGEPILVEGLASLSELAFSCFLNPGSGSVVGALEVEESLASLTAAAAAATAEAVAEAPGAAGEPRETSDAIGASCPTRSSSLLLPVTAVPLQQLLSTQTPGFGDTLLLQPSQSSLGGFLRSVGPAPGLPPAPSSGAGRPRGGGCPAPGPAGLRRIAPKAAPACPEAEPEPCSSSSSSSGPGDRPALTRASEEVLSKCKKAAAEDHVVLVEGEKKYACGICCKTFMNLTDCKKHIRVHTGEKPYPCPGCGKRFSQSSHLYKHSKNTCLHWAADRPHPLADSLL